MSAFSLTVGIPTFNRARDIGVAIESVMAQVGDRYRDRFDILISDNASTDATEEVVRSYVERYPGWVGYRRNPRNVGFSRNVDALVRSARGDFVLLLSDDDGLEADALSTLWAILEQHEGLGVVILSETLYDSDLRLPMALPPSAQPARSGGVLYSPGADYVSQRRIFPPFLVSGYVVRREAWVKADPGEFCETICVHALTALRILSRYDAYVSYAPSIRYRVENVKEGNRWLDELYPFTFHLNLLVGCRGVKSAYPAASYRCLHRQAMRAIVYTVAEQKKAGAAIPSELLRCRLAELADPRDPLYWIALLLLRLPFWMIRMPYHALLAARRAARRLSRS